MKRCAKAETLFVDGHACTENIDAHVQALFNNHLGAIFIVALLLIGFLSYAANRKPNPRPLRDDNNNYQLGRINDGIGRGLR